MATRDRAAFHPACSPTTASKPPTGERWTHEVKWDGFRFQVVKVGREVRLFSRNGIDWTERMPAIAAAFACLPARVAQIDGELCLCDVDGRPDFRALMRAARQRRADETRLSFHAFDLLQLNAADLKPKPLAERRRRLVDLVHRLDEAVPALYLPDAFTSGDELLAMCAKLRTRGDRLEATGSAVRLGSDARLGQGQVRRLERGEPLARRGV